MTSIYSVIFWIVLNISSCRLQCVPETHDDNKFAINVTEHIEVESIECFVIKYEMTFPQDKITVPHKKMLFERDPSNIVSTEIVDDTDDTDGFFMINERPRGEYKYGFILEWGCNQTYVFPKKVHISVTAPKSKPDLYVPNLVEGQYVILRCRAPRTCSRRAYVRWYWTTNDGNSTELEFSALGYYGHKWFDAEDLFFTKLREQLFGEKLNLYPTAEHHNTNITCLAQYEHDAIQTTVTLTVKFPPKILSGSHCLVKGELLVCVCVSWGNPLPPVIWPLKPLTDYSISSSSSSQTVSSTITLSAAEHHNSTMTCISRNEVGQNETEILIKNSTETQLSYISDEKKRFEAALPWITAVCFSLNLVFITVLIFCIYQRSKMKQKKLCEENNTYASLRKAEVEDEYSVIPS